MARKYARDKRGRFSSTGATARGSRLGGKKSTMRAPQQGRPMPVSTPGGVVSASRKGRKAAVANRAVAERQASKTATRNAKAGEARKAQFAGKSAKNTKARASYKEAASRVRSSGGQVARMKQVGRASKEDIKFFSKIASKDKSNLTRVTKRLTGKAKKKK